MHWQEQDTTISHAAADLVTDLCFRIRCRRLPVDHAHTLSTAVRQELPWIGQNKGVAIHTIHIAESGNGWLRPEQGASEVLLLSLRTRFILRLPIAMVEKAKKLCGKTLDLPGFPIQVGNAGMRALVASTTLLARHVLVGEGENEDRFIQRILSTLQSMQIVTPKILCGRSHTIQGRQKTYQTSSVLLGDLSTTDSIRLQQQGLGDHQLLGCGIFIPHKSINAIH